MSRKHNTQHARTPGGYKRRLRKQGLERSPMTPWDQESLKKARDRTTIRSSR